MIKYRPHRGLLAESMELCREFNTVDEMIKYIEKDYDNVSIDNKEYTDNRINWNHWHYVLANDCAIGMCDLGEDK